VLGENREIHQGRIGDQDGQVASVHVAVIREIARCGGLYIHTDRVRSRGCSGCLDFYGVLSGGKSGGIPGCLPEMGIAGVARGCELPVPTLCESDQLPELTSFFR
jgi:hypothetical protein